MFKELFIDIFFEDGILGCILGLCLWAACGCLMWLIFWGVSITADSSGVQTQEHEGIIISKEFVPGHTILISVYNAALKMYTTQPIHCDDAWYVTASVNGQKSTLEITQKAFNKIKKGDIHVFKYKLGRFSHKIYLKEMNPKKMKEINGNLNHIP